MNKFKYSNDNKRYHTYNFYLKNKYHHKVAKVALNAGFTCPNRDGTKGTGGCIFCSDSGSGDYAGNQNDTLKEQFNTVSKIMANKWPDCKLIPYFQANTNTYGPLEKIQKMVEEVTNIDNENIVGLTLATRPDCLEDDVVEYLSQLNHKCDLWIELGLQTIHDNTAKIINRGHTYDEFLEGLHKLRAHNINVCVHIINGLPFETTAMMLETAKVVGTLDIQAIKIHNLFIIRNTKIAKMYNNNEFELINREEYIKLVTNQLQYIPEHVVVERLTGDGKIDDLIAPLWSIKKVTILNDIDKLMALNDIYQGDLCNKKT